MKWGLLFYSEQRLYISITCTLTLLYLFQCCWLCFTVYVIHDENQLQHHLRAKDLLSINEYMYIQYRPDRDNWFNFQAFLPIVVCLIRKRFMMTIERRADGQTATQTLFPFQFASSYPSSLSRSSWNKHFTPKTREVVHVNFCLTKQLMCVLLIHSNGMADALKTSRFWKGYEWNSSWNVHIVFHQETLK